MNWLDPELGKEEPMWLWVEGWSEEQNAREKPVWEPSWERSGKPWLELVVEGVNTVGWIQYVGSSQQVSIASLCWSA